MSGSPLPGMPLLIILTGLALTGAASILYVQAAPEPTSITLPDIEPAGAQPTATVVLYNMPEVTARLTNDIMRTSPFAPDRSAYSRVAPVPARPAPPKPTYNPQFVGISGGGSSVQALIIWNPGEPVIETSIGDDTPWGALISATPTALQFEGEEGSKTLRMF